MGLTKWPGSKPDAHTPELVARLLNALKPPTILRQFSHSDSNGAETNFVYNKLRRDAIWQKNFDKHLTIVWNFKKVVASTWEKKILAYLRGAAELMCQGKYLDDLMLIVLLILTTLLLLVTMIWRV